MMTFLRKHRGWLMIVIAILTIPFCLYFVKTDVFYPREKGGFTIYDQHVSLVEARKIARLYYLARNLGLTDLQNDLSAGGKDENETVFSFILNLLILRHEADRMGIRPTQSEVVDLVHTLPPFRGANGFDLKKYDDFVQNALAPFGLDEGEMEELVRDDLALKSIKRLVNTGVSLSPEVSKADFGDAYSKLYTAVVHLSAADVVKDIKIGDEEIKKYFDAHKDEFKTEEKRKVDFVELALTEEQKKLKGKERIDALQKLADRANDVSQALLEKGADFGKVAARFHLPEHTTGDFTAATPDPQFQNAGAQLDSTAFKLTKQEPISDPIQVGDGFYILHLASATDSRPLTFEEAKPKVVDAIKKSRSQQLLSTRGAEIARQLREGIKSNEPIEAAAQKAGVKAEKIPPFSLIDEAKTNENEKKPAEPPDMMLIKNAAARLQPGEVSDFVPFGDGGVLVALEKREPPDGAKYRENKEEFDERYLKGKQQVVFYEWLRDRQRDAGLEQPAPPAG